MLNKYNKERYLREPPKERRSPSKVLAKEGWGGRKMIYKGNVLSRSGLHNKPCIAKSLWSTSREVPGWRICLLSPPHTLPNPPSGSISSRQPLRNVESPVGVISQFSRDRGLPLPTGIVHGGTVMAGQFRLPTLSRHEPSLGREWLR